MGVLGMTSLFRSLKNLNRDAALDSARSVLAAIGAGTILASLNTLPILYACIGVLVTLLVWYLDYVRHF